VSFLFAPNRDNLGHYARKVRVHHSSEQRSSRRLGREINYSDA
jgi:hypothetical protein